MQNPALDTLRHWITADNPRLALLGLLCVAVVAGLLVGALFGGLGPIIAIGLIVALTVFAIDGLSEALRGRIMQGARQ